MAMTRFKKLEVTQIASTSCCMVIGRRGTGKTVLMKNLAYHMFADKCRNGDTIDMAIVFSPTESMQHVFEKFVPKCFIYNDYREDVVAQLLATQRELIEKNGHTKTVLLILDDLAYDKKFFNTKAFRELVMNGRHCKIFIMCAVQYVMDIPTAIRGNIDVTFSMADNSAQNRERLQLNLFSQVPKREFSKLFEQLTNDRSAIVSLNNSNSTRLEDTVFRYRADPDNCPDRFALGHPIFWRMNDLCSGGDGSIPQGYVTTPPPPPSPPPIPQPSVPAPPAHTRPVNNRPPPPTSPALSPTSSPYTHAATASRPGDDGYGTAGVQRTRNACAPMGRRARHSTLPEMLSF